jgi:N-alpha-acetyl-L-2,4-diaminobutyrate deacetylase
MTSPRQTPSPRPSSAFLTVDPEKDGKQVGFLMIPHSPDDDAWGATRIPVAIIKNGSGPTAILEGGNHGDEYEGPITICDLIRDLDPARVQGRLILMPANNVHAVIAGKRTSSVDGLNFNRTFPGDPRGTITQQIAAFVSDRILPLGDAFLDLHSGGSSLDIIPSAIVEPTDDPELHKRNVAAVQAFDAPMTVVISNLGEPRTATATACRQGLVTVGTEMAGAGTVSLDALKICRRGVANVLDHLGIVAATRRSHAAAMGRCSSCPASRPMSTPRRTASSSRSTPMARRSGPASRRGASIAPGTRLARPKRCITPQTPSSMAGASRAGSGREIAA